MKFLVARTDRWTQLNIIRGCLTSVWLMVYSHWVEPRPTQELGNNGLITSGGGGGGGFNTDEKIPPTG